MPRSFFTLLLIAGALCVRADATAFAAVEKAFWQADFAYYYDPITNTQLGALPSGVTMHCIGSASADGLGGCMDQRGTQVSSNSNAFMASVINTLGGYELQNTTDTDYAGTFVFNTMFSSFNPGGPEIGARVDNPAAEFASFFTVVRGPGVFDLHGCTMNHGHHHGTQTSPNSCGVSSPDVSWGTAALGPLPAGGTVNADYQVFIHVTAQGSDPVPEAPALMFLATGLGLLALGRRRLAASRT